MNKANAPSAFELNTQPHSNSSLLQGPELEPGERPSSSGRGRGRQKAEHGREHQEKPWECAHSKHKVRGQEFDAGDALKVARARTKPKHSQLLTSLT